MPTGPISVGPAYDLFRPDDLDAVAYLVRQGFGIPRDDLLRFRDLLDDGAFRVLRQDGRPVACAAVWTTDQWFGGQPVPSRAVAAMAVDPAARGSGLGGAMMAGILREAQAEGCGLSVLYAATLPLYAKVGYARAGSAINYRAAPSVLASGRADGLRRLDPLDAPLDADALAALRRREARSSNGLVERDEARWTLLLKPGDEQAADVFVADGPDGPEGYVAVLPPADGRLVVVDVCVHGRRAARRVLSFLAGYRAQVERVVWPGGPEDPLVHLAADAGVEIDEWDEWLARVVDVERALSRRGYPPEVEGTLVLDVADPLLAGNHGRFRLSVGQGRGDVQRVTGAGSADVVLPVAALAPLYTGHLGAAALARMGLLEGCEAGIALAAKLFAGPRPWMADRF
ncbi:GNAT family N-acetyltransferase [Azospirillum sp. sgz301742]